MTWLGSTAMGAKRIEEQAVEGPRRVPDSHAADVPPEDSADSRAVVAARIRAAGQRALAEAEARRRAEGNPPPRRPEIGGPPGPDPVRYGDWDVKGLASDF